MSKRRRVGILRLFGLLILLAKLAFATEVPPVLNFPEAGMDDPARYKEYVTRFYRDSSKNAIEIYVNQATGRVVHLWADSANESVSFTIRVAPGQAHLQWCSETADVSNQTDQRFIEYDLCAASPTVEIGHLLLGTMRKERDFQYFKKDQLPFDSEPFLEPELLQLIANLEKLPAEERDSELKILQAQDVQALRNRMEPVLKQNGSVVSAEQVSFDGKNHLWLDLDADEAQVKMNPHSISISSADKQQIRLRIKVGTDSAPLTPLDRNEIFNEAFQKFYSDMQNRASNSAQAKTDYQWIEREVRGMELVSYHEKLMAGLPNFATYFGRDTMMSAFMFTPIWSDSMLQHSIESVLRKLSPHGDASHEEALGGQAIRENAGEYNKIIEHYLKKADSTELTQARDILSNLQKVRENYKMIDDDFQLPILIGRFLTNPKIASENKRVFLQNWLPRILKNFAYVSEATHPYVLHPDALHLVSFRKEEGRWVSASWRDSDPGYAGGRFAMDVNVIFVPNALESIADCLEYLKSAGYAQSQFSGMLKDVSPVSRSLLMQYVQNPATLQKAIGAWRHTDRHFWVKLTQPQYMSGVQAKIASLPEEQQAYWKEVLANQTGLPESLEFLTLSLDETGKPIKVVNTDPATLLFLENHAQRIAANREQAEDVFKIIRPILISYPVGLFIENLGPVCANDAYSTPAIWAKWEKDLYHSPRVVWGREANLFSLGLMKEIVEAQKPQDKNLNAYISTLQDALARTREAVEASGLKHNELWSYEIRDGKLMPVRYGTSSDIQLWNLTDLSIQFLLNQVKE